MEQKQKPELENKWITTRRDILGDLPIDEAVAVPNKRSISSSGERNLSGSQMIRSDRSQNQHLIDIYMRRPKCLEDMSLQRFHSYYKTKKLPKNARAERFERMKLLCESTYSNEFADVFIAVSRETQDRRPSISHIINVPNRGKADESSPLFAAAALALHLPFRSLDDLLCGKILTDRLRELLETAKYPELVTYVQRCRELSVISRVRPTGETAFGGPNGNCDERLPSCDDDVLGETISGVNIHGDFEEDIDAYPANPLAGIPPLITRTGIECGAVKMEWNGCAQSINHQSSYCPEDFLQYVKDCKSKGLIAASKALDGDLNGECLDKNPDISMLEQENGTLHEIERVRYKLQILDRCRTSEQRNWISTVFSYLDAFYSQEKMSEELHDTVKKLCEVNPIMFTNAPGGCRKSWLLEKVHDYASKFIPTGSVPYGEEILEPAECGDTFQIFGTDPNSQKDTYGRLGRVAVLAPTGVSASNINGFTFHDGLRTFPITISSILTDPSPKLIAKLSYDFINVVCIIIDEFSMVSLVLLAYLDKILRILSPAFGDRFFWLNTNSDYRRCFSAPCRERTRTSL